MGNKCFTICKQSKQIRVGSLNFSGIALSPFQYYDDTTQLEQINSLYKKVFAKYIKQQNFQWQVGQIDLKLQKQRYSPVYRDDVCVINNHLVNRTQFQGLWDKQFEKNKKIIKKQITQTHITQSKLFDWIVYQTIINYVYNKSNILRITVQTYNLIDFQNIKNYDPSSFLEFLKVWHSKPYLDVNVKINKIKQYLKINDLDVIFMQEAVLSSGATWSNLVSGDYDIIGQEDRQSIIIYKKSKFSVTPQSQENFNNKYKDKLNFNNDSVFLKSQNFLLISAHLSSKKQKNSAQVNEMLATLKQLRTNYPSLKIIIGMDANAKIQRKSIIDIDFHNYIEGKQDQVTSVKKRTDIQLQTKKANVVVNKTEDYILSNKEIKQIKVCQINGNQYGHRYLPNQDHPYDHFLITAIIDDSE